MKLQDQIQVETNERGHRFHVIYDKAGVRHEIGQLADAISACETGAYFARPPVDKIKKRIKK